MSISIKDLTELLQEIVELKNDGKTFNVECLFTKYEEDTKPALDEDGNDTYEALIGEIYVPVIRLESGKFVHPEAILTEETEIRARTVTENKLRRIPYTITHDDIDLDESFVECFGYADAVLESAEVCLFRTFKVVVRTYVFSELIVTAEDADDAGDLAVIAVRDNLDCDYRIRDENVELEGVEVCDSDVDACEEIED